MPAASQRLLFALLCFASLTVWVRESWAAAAFQAGIFLLFASRAGSIPLRTLLPVAALPAAGLLQLALGLSAVPSFTVEAVLHWASLAAVFVLARHECADPSLRTRFLTAAAAFGGAMSVLCLVQLNTSQGRFLWYFDSGHRDAIYASFASYDNWAQFAEMTLPLAIWKIADSRARGPLWSAVSGLTIASVIATGARAGTLICTALALVSLGALATRGAEMRRKLAIPLLLAPVAAVAFTVIAGTDLVWKRLHQGAPYQDRMHYLLSSIDLIRERPLLGWGLGTWPLVYPRKARIDDSVFVNRAHNDWAEYTSDGGFVFLAALATPFARALPWIPANPWAAGIAGVLLHAFVDYPFPRAGVSAWLFALLGALYAARPKRRLTGAVPAGENRSGATAPGAARTGIRRT